MKTFIKYHLPVALYAVAVLVLPSLPSLSAPAVRFLASDKVAHFLEYAVFAFLAFRSLSHSGRSRGWKSVVALTFLLLAAFGAVDEVLQRFVPGRHPDFWDYTADLGGALVSLAVLGWWAGRRASVD